jgi:hypothetical protein
LEAFEKADKALADMAATDFDAAIDSWHAINEAANGYGVEISTLMELFPGWYAAWEEHNRVVGEEAVEADMAAAEAEAEAAAEARELADAARAVGLSMGYAVEMSDEAAAGLQAWRDQVSGAYTQFMDLQGANKTVMEGLRKEGESLTDTSKKWAGLGVDATASLDQIIDQLKKQKEVQDAWASNLELLGQKIAAMPQGLQAAGRDLWNELEQMGPAGAAMVDEIASATDEQMVELLEVWQAGGDQAGQEFARGMEPYANPMISIGANGDIALEDADGVTIKIGEMGAVIQIDADTSKAEAQVQDLRQYVVDTVIAAKLQIHANMLGPIIPPLRGRASGGLIPGRAPSASVDDRLAVTSSGTVFGVQSGEFVSNLGSVDRNLDALTAANAGATLTVADPTGALPLSSVLSAPGGAAGAVSQPGNTLSVTQQIAAAPGWDVHRLAREVVSVLRFEARADGIMV